MRQEITSETLQKYLERIAWKLHHMTGQTIDGEDILSEMNLHICERAAADPTFLDQAPGYISKAAAWHARSWLRRQLHGQGLELNILDSETEDGQLKSELFAAKSQDNDLTIAVHDTLDTLEGRLRQIGELLMEGYRKSEIADELGMSRANVSYYVRLLRQEFAGLEWAAV